MAVRTTLFIVSSFALVLALAACGSGRTGPGTDAGHRTDLGPAHDMGPLTDLGVLHDAGMTSTDMGTPPVDLGRTGSDGGMCIASCTVDFDCSRTCPVMTGHAQCCDRATHHCFPAGGAVCPAPVDAGTDASMY